jgi:hypothetical protein
MYSIQKNANREHTFMTCFTFGDISGQPRFSFQNTKLWQSNIHFSEIYGSHGSREGDITHDLLFEEQGLYN